MSRGKKYGIMPAGLGLEARVRGDAGRYKVWGVDWLHHRVLVDRAGLEWISIEKVALEPADAGVDSRAQGEREATG